MTPAIRPLSDRIVVKRLPDPNSPSSIIEVPERAETKSLRGLVLAVGPGRRAEDGSRIPVDVRPGQTVLFGPLNDYELDDLCFIREADVRVVIDG
jgi:chaperonin GroES